MCIHTSDNVVCQLIMTAAMNENSVGQAAAEDIISLEAKIGNIQIDNFSAPLSPVMLYTRKALLSKSAYTYTGSNPTDNSSNNGNSTDSKTAADPFLYVAIVKAKSDLVIPKFKLFVVNLAEIFVSVETNLIYLYLSDIHDAFRKVRSVRQYQCDKNPLEWIQRNSINLVSVREKVCLVNLKDCLKQIVDKQYIYIQNLKICPLKVHVTYIQAAFLRTAAEELRLLTEYDMLDKIKLIGNTLDDVTVRLSEYVSDGIMEPLEQLAIRVVTSIILDILKQLPQLMGNLVGSLDVLGKPITFAKNIGTGLQDFFFEPTAGLLQASPQVFVCMYMC